MTERTVKLRLGMDISGLQSQAKAATAAMADFSKKSVAYIEKNSASIEDLSTKVGVVGVSLVALATTAVTRFAQFDKAMSAVAATGDDARGSLDALRQAAVDAGADTAFSAQEAAGAIEQLAKAGVSAKDILGGGLDGALALAAAGEIDVAEAAETAASAMTQFNLKGTDVGHIADLLAAGAGKAQGGVSDMGAALNQAGLIAGQVGLSIEETTGSLAAMASAGLTGSDAGTSLKTSLIALSSPSSVAAKEMKRLRISAYDANGEFIGMEALAGQLQTRLGGLTDEQRNSALATIFGTDALRTANVLYSEGAAGIAEWTSAVDDQGYAAETAAAQTDNLIGDIERLGGSVDSVLIQAGSGANDGLRQIVQGTEAVVDGLGEIPGPALSATAAIAGTGGLALLGIAGLGKLAVSVVEAKTAITALGISTKTASLAAGGLGAALAIGTIAFTTWAQNAAEAKARTEEFQGTLDSLGATTDSTLSAINDRLSENQNDWFDNILGDDPESLIDRAQRIGLAVEDLQGYILGNADATEKVTQATRDYIAAQGDDLTTMDIRAQAGRFLTDSLDAEAGALTDAQKATAQKQLADEAAGVAAGDLAAATGGVTEATAVYTDAIQENIDAQREAAGVVLSLRDAQSAAEAAYDDAAAAIDENGKTLDVTTEKGRANRSALDSIAESGWDLVDSMRANGASQTDLQNTMSTTRERFIETARAAGATKAEARALADQLLLHPKNVHTDITADGGQARNEGKKTKDYLNSLSAAIQVAADTGSAYAQANAIQNYINGLNATITVRERHVSSGLPGSRSGGITRAAGGPIPMVPGAVPGKDSVHVLAMPNEHMLTTADVRAMGGHAGVYAWRASLHSGGVQHMAKGGAVGTAQDAVNYWWGEVSDARDGLRAARRRKSERAEQQAEARLDRAQEKLDVAQERRDRLREEAADLGTSLRRGDIRDSVTGGLSGAYSSVDELRSMAASGDLGGSRSGRLRMVANVAERQLESLYSAAERAEKKVAATKDRLDELLQVQAGVRTSIVGGFGLSDVVGSFDETTGKRAASGSQLAAAAAAYAGKARTFAGLLGQLGAKGGSAAIVQEVAGYGVEQGTPIAQSLLADLGSLRSLSASYADIATYGGWAGANVARAVGGGRGIGESMQDARTAQAQANAIDKKIGSWAKTIGVEMAKALGVRHRAAGGPMLPGGAYITGEFGRELVLPQSPQYVLTADATRRLATTSSPGGYGGGAATTYNDNSLSVTTNQHVSERELLRFDQKRQLLRGRS